MLETSFHAIQVLGIPYERMNQTTQLFPSYHARKLLEAQGSVIIPVLRFSRWKNCPR